MNITFPIAFLAGLATFFSPCILPVIPGYLSVLSGGERAQVMRRALFFALGLALVFATLGVVIGWVGPAVVPARDTIIKILGIVLIVYGVHLIKPLPLGFLSREFKIKVEKAGGSDLGALVLGGAFGLAWTPCSGVILGTILAQAIFFQVGQATPLLLSFSLGMIIPMLALAYLYQRGTGSVRLPQWLVRYYSPAIGIFVVVLGLSLVTGWIDYWRANLLAIFPGLESGLLPLIR